MKRILIYVFLSFVYCLSAVSQDIIMMRDGTEIMSKALKVSNLEIEYKKWSNLEGPTYSISRDQVFMIKYQNGEKDIFDLKEINISTDEKTFNTEITPDDNNSRLIYRINSMPENADGKKERKTKAKIVAAFMGITEESLLSSDDFEILFDREFIELGMMKGQTVYNIKFKNKTDKIIYVDKANCFIIDNENRATQFYSPNEVTTTMGRDVGAGIALGSIGALLNIKGPVRTIVDGISLNGGFSEFTSVTEIDQQILTIPPKASVYLIKGLKIPLFFVEKGLLKMGECKSFSYSESPMKWRYFFTYSFNKYCDDTRQIDIKAYCNFLYGYMGFPILGGNLVASSMRIYATQVYTTFDCRDENVTRYNVYKPNITNIE